MQRPFKSLSVLREKHPLVHNITNYVVMNSTANALLAVGASPSDRNLTETAGHRRSFSHSWQRIGDFSSGRPNLRSPRSR